MYAFAQVHQQKLTHEYQQQQMSCSPSCPERSGAPRGYVWFSNLGVWLIPTRYR